MAVSKAESLFQTAKELSEKGDWDGAIEKFQKVLEADSKDERVCMELATLYGRRGKIPEMVNQYLALALIKEEKGELDGVVKACNWVLKLDPHNVDARSKIIRVYEQKGMTSEVLQSSMLLSRLMQVLGLYEEATQVVQRLHEYQPDNLDLALQLGEMYVKQGSIQEGVAQYKKMAEVFVGIKDMERAAETLKRIKVLRHDDVDNLFALGTAYRALGKLDEAIQEFRLILRYNISHIQALTQLGLCLRERNLINEAILAFRKLVEIAPEDPFGRFQFAELQEAKGNSEEAVKQFLSAGELYVKQHSRDEAGSAYKRALALNPNEETASRQLAALGFSAEEIARPVVRAEVPTPAPAAPDLIKPPPEEAQVVSAGIEDEAPPSVREEADKREAVETKPSPARQGKGLFRRAPLVSEGAAPQTQETRPPLRQGASAPMEPATGLSGASRGGLFRTGGGAPVAKAPETEQEAPPVLPFVKSDGNDGNASKPSRTGAIKPKTTRPSVEDALPPSKSGLIKAKDLGDQVRPGKLLPRGEEEQSGQAAGGRPTKPMLIKASQKVERATEDQEETTPPAEIAEDKEELVPEAEIASAMEIREEEPAPETTPTDVSEASEVATRVPIEADLSLVPEVEAPPGPQASLPVSGVPDEGLEEGLGERIMERREGEELLLSEPEGAHREETSPGEEMLSALAFPEGEEIIQKARDYIASEPSDFRVQEALADGLFRLGMGEEAIPELEALCERAPENPQYRLKLILCCLAAGDVEKAADSFAQLAENSGDSRTARKLYQDALAIVPHHMEAGERLLEIYLGEGKKNLACRFSMQMADSCEKADHVPGATFFLNKLLDLQGDSLPVHERLAALYERSGSASLAVKHLKSLAEAHLREKSFEKAISPYSKVLELHPDAVEERQILAGLYARLNQKEKALEVEMELASIFFEKGELDESAAICAKIVSEDPKHIRAHQKLLEIHTRTGQKDKAKEESRVLAEVLAQDNQLDSAIEMLQNIVKTNPGDLSARGNLCEMLERSGFTGRALSEYLALGGESDKHGDLEGAIEAYRKAVSLDHASVDAHLLLGKTLLEKKQDLPGGVRELEIVCELHPNHTDALSLLWFGHVSLGSAIPALETGAILQRLDTGSAALFSKMKEDLEQVAKKDTSNIQALYKLALVHLVSGEHELAIRVLQSAAKKVPENVVKLYGLAGHCFVDSACMKKEKGSKEGDSDWDSDMFAAKAQFQKALQYKGKRPDEDFLELHYFFGNYYQVMGQKKEALAQYEEALKIDPDHRYSKEKSATIEV